jgi:hypothetical protein
MSDFVQFPPQQLSFKRKNKKWRKTVLDWADTKSFTHYSPVRNSVLHKKINYDLMNGILHMKDMEIVLNPEAIKSKYLPEKIQHYPIINSKINVLIGEELGRVFDYKVVVTNPNAISEIEENKKQQILKEITAELQNESQSEEEFNQRLQKINDFFSYEWQDMRELRCNMLLNHYVKEDNLPLLFNKGFKDGLITGEEIYRCDIRNGEPIIEKLNPNKVYVFKSGYSNKIEDADVIIIEDYLSPGQIIDRYYEYLSAKDREYIEGLPYSNSNETNEEEPRNAWISSDLVGDENNGFFSNMLEFTEGNTTAIDTPFDMYGNVRVLQVYWKSRRKIKKVKSYNQETGEEEFNFYPETYVCDETKGEEETTYWINEAWEGTKIGKDIYVNMRPRIVQYNRLSNPSRCHFGIVGSIYNLNEDKPFSLVDMMKPFSYLYDATHDKLTKLLARDWGILLPVDLAKIPDKWSVDKWLYFAKTNGIVVVDSFKEGNKGAATGKLAGGLNNNTSGAINAELGNSIQGYINILEYIKSEMSEVIGVSKQREGQISNRETVGGVERSTLQSSYITEYLFNIHEDVKRRVLECFIETAKAALKGRNKKFQYILPDGLSKIITIDGDEFAENDYGLVVDNSKGTQELNQKLDMLAQAALQNQALDFSAILKLYTSCSMAEKIRMISNNEQQRKQEMQQQQEQQSRLQQQQLEQNVKLKQDEMEQQYKIAQEKNQTSITVAEINAQSNLQYNLMKNQNDGVDEVSIEEARAKLQESMRQFDANLDLNKKKLELDKLKADRDYTIQQRKLSQTQKNKTIT